MNHNQTESLWFVVCLATRQDQSGNTDAICDHQLLGKIDTIADHYR